MLYKNVKKKIELTFLIFLDKRSSTFSNIRPRVLKVKLALEKCFIDDNPPPLPLKDV